MDLSRALGAKALYVHRFLVRVAGASVVAFLWLFILGYFVGEGLSLPDAIAHTLFLYALSEIVTLLTTPLALMYIRGSMLRGLAFGTAFLALAYCYTGSLAGGLFPHGVAVIGVLFGLYRALYRVPYQMEREALASGAASPARELALAAMPALAGSTLSLGLSFTSLMSIAALLALIALALLPLIPNTRDDYAWTYRETFGRFLHEGNASLVYRAMLSGARGVALVVLWPFALVALGVRSPGLLGALVSVVLLVTIRFGSGRGLRALEQAADGGRYVDEYTALKEMGRAFGAAFVCCAVAALAALF